VGAARRLLDCAPAIRSAVDLSGASLAIDDCYELWDSGGWVGGRVGGWVCSCRGRSGHALLHSAAGVCCVCRRLTSPPVCLYLPSRLLPPPLCRLHLDSSRLQPL
jgi:hypothetical protein